MKIAYTGWTWLINHKDNYKYEFEQFLKEVADVGYDSVENFAFITKYFDNDAAEVSALLKKYNLEMVNLYEHFSDDSEADYASAVAYVDFMKKIGATYLNLQGTMWRDAPENRPLDKAKVDMYAELSNRIGKLCTDNGIKACMHPHANTPLFAEGDIDYYCEKTDPELVWLCLDTAHTVLAGMDPVAAFTKYLPRLGYVHLKDVTAQEAVPGQRMSRFAALGLGTVDFPSVVSAIRKGGYDGVLCVELDRPHVCNYKSALVSRQYIHNALGL